MLDGQRSPPFSHELAPSTGAMPGLAPRSFSMLLIKHESAQDPVLRRSLADARARLRKLREKVLAPSDFNIRQPPKPKEVRQRFAAAAKAHSDDGDSAAQGGDIGVLEPGRWPAELEAVAGELAIGSLSEEVTTEEGVHLLLRTS